MMPRFYAPAPLLARCEPRKSPLCIFRNALTRAPRANPLTCGFGQYGNALVLGLQVTIEL